MQHKDRKITCQCGHLQGVLSGAARGTRLTCYCKDCQAYAHALSNASGVLDAFGGSEVLSTLQQHVRFTKGTEALACLSLSETGMLRWYASCCNTPIGNTPRDARLSFVSLSASCLGEALDAQFGTSRVNLNSKSASGPVASSGMGQLFAIAGIVGSALKARANGSWKHSPFFRPGSLKPSAAPRVLSSEERMRYTPRASAV